MKFVQTIEFKSHQIDEVRKIFDEYDQSAAIGFERSALCEDRGHPGSYLAIVQFSSYEEAMQNSARPETDEMASRMRELVDGEVVYLNLDVLEER
jgi:hypothetical protein